MTELDNRGAKLVSLAIVAFGLYIIWEGAGMNVGQLRRIGPGFFPIVLGIAITLLGIGTLFEPSERRRGEPFGLRPLVFVTLGLLAFALLARSMGLVPATFAMVAFTALGQHKVDVKASLLTAIFLCAIGYGVFILGLGLPIRLFAANAFGGWG